MNERTQKTTIFQSTGQVADTDRKAEFQTHLSWSSPPGGLAGLIMDDDIETQVDPLAGELHVKELWKCLGIGENGYLTVSELGRVCRHIGMEEMKEWEVHQLFDQLDADGDGQVTFDEFLSEMFQYSAPTLDENVTSPQLQSASLPCPSSQTTATQVSRTKSRRRRSFIRKTGMPHHESFFLSQGETSHSFTTLDVNNKGRIKGEDLVELWESYGIPNAMDVLKAYGFEPDRELSHAKLAAVLEDELLFTADHTPKLQAAIITCLQECKNLRCLLEQASAERDRLIIGLRESNIRSQILAEEDDERHAALEKTLQTKVLSMEGIYQEQIKNLKEELKKEREERMDVMDEHDQMIEKMTTSYREESKKLKEDLSTTQEDLRQTQTELNEVRERVKDLERQKHKLQYQLSVEKLKSGGKTLSEQWEIFQATSDSHNMMRQQIAQLQNENKHLGDRLEELSPQCRRINHRTTDRRKNLSRSMSLREQSLGELFPGTMDILHRPTGSPFDRDEFNQMQRELKQLKKNMEIEHKEIEHAYLIEIAQIEERHNYEMSEAIKQAKREKEKILEDRTKRQQEALAKLEKELQTQFALEKQDLLLKHETEKNLLEQKLAEDKIRLTERLRSEYMDDLQRKTRQMEKSISGECPSWQVSGAVPGSRHTANEELSLETARESVSPSPAPDNVPSNTVVNSGDDPPIDNGCTGAQLPPATPTPATSVSVGSQCQQHRDGDAEPSKQGPAPQPKCAESGSASHRGFGYQSPYVPNPMSTTEMIATLPDIYEEIALVSSHHAPMAPAERSTTGRSEEGATSSGEAADGDREAVDGGRSEETSSATTSLRNADQADTKKLVIQLCCLEELNQVDGSKLQHLFEKGMENKLRGEFIKALTKYRDEEILRANSSEKDSNSASDASDNASRPRNPPSSPSSSSSTSSSSISESHKTRGSKSFRFRSKNADGDGGDKRHLIHRYEEKLKSQEREIHRLKRRSMDQSEPSPPKEYSVKSAVTNLGYQLLFPRQKHNKATQTEQRRHLHRNMSDLHLKCFYQEEKLQNLEKELSHREEQTHSVMKNVEDTYRNVIHKIEEEREQLKNQLISTTEALQDQSGKLQEQQSKSMNRDLLLKDLYMQNAELMRSLQQMEDQLRTADQKNLQLEEKCRVLDKVLQKATDEDSPKEPFLDKPFDVPPKRRNRGPVIYITRADKCYRSSKDGTTGDRGSILKSDDDANEPKDRSETRQSFGSVKNVEDLTAKTTPKSPVYSRSDTDNSDGVGLAGVSDGENLASSSGLDAQWGELDKADYSDADCSDTIAYRSDDQESFPEFDDMAGTVEAGMVEAGTVETVSENNDDDDASFAENLGNDSDATDLDGFDFTDEEEDIFLDTTAGRIDGNETECTREKAFHENGTESQKQIENQTEDEVKKDGTDRHDVCQSSLSKSDDNEADDVRLEFLAELEEKYTQVRQLVFLVKDTKIQRTLIEVDRWILQTHQRLQY